VAGFKHPCLKPLGVHLKARVIALQNFCKISNFLQNLVLIPQHSPFPTVPLSLKNPQHYQRSEFAAAHSRKVDFATAHSRLTICIAPSSIPNRSATPQKSATLSKVGICCGSQPQGRNLLRLTAARSEFAAAHSRKVDFATAHSRLTICIAPSSIPNRSATPQKSATLSKVGICCGSQPQGRFCYGSQPPDNLHSTIAKPRPFRYPSKIRNVSKGRNLLRLTAARSILLRLTAA